MRVAFVGGWIQFWEVYMCVRGVFCQLLRCLSRLALLPLARVSSLSSVLSVSLLAVFLCAGLQLLQIVLSDVLCHLDLGLDLVVGGMTDVLGGITGPELSLSNVLSVHYRVFLGEAMEVVQIAKGQQQVRVSSWTCEI